MANYFTLASGDILDSTKYGTSIVSSEVVDQNWNLFNLTQSYVLTSDSIFMPAVSATGEPITALAVGVSCVSANSTDNLIVDIIKTSNPFVFVDSSSNNFPISFIGAPYHVPLSPYSAERKSGYSQHHQTLPSIAVSVSSTEFAFGTGDFTIESFIYPTSITAAENATIIADYAGKTTNGGWSLYLNPNNQLVFFADNQSRATTSTSLPLNTWSHVAAVRTGNVISLYVNGVSAVSGAYTGNITVSVNVGVTIGSWYTNTTTVANPFKGYLSNVRVVKGRSMYTGTFTVPTNDLDIVSTGGGTTSLLALKSTDQYIKDNSNNNFRLITSLNNNESIAFVNFSPFANNVNQNYNLLDHKSSCFLNGTASLTIQNSAINAFNYVSNSWLVETWVNRTDSALTDTIFAIGGGVEAFNATTGHLVRLYHTATNLTIDYYNGSTGPTLTTTPLHNGSWNHVAVQYNASTTRLTVWVNGISVISSNITLAKPSAVDRFTIGGSGTSTSRFINGYISNTRFVQGLVYDTSLSTITVPTSPFTNNSNTIILLSFDNYGIVKDNQTLTYPISCFTQSNSNNGLNKLYPDNWQTLNLNTPISTLSADSIQIKYRTSKPNQIALNGPITFHGVKPKSYTIKNTTGKVMALPSVYKFNPLNSIFFDTNTRIQSYIQIFNTDIVEFRREDFTIEGWFYPLKTADNSQRSIPLFTISNTGGSIPYLYLWMNSSSTAASFTLRANNISYGSVTIEGDIYGSVLPLADWSHVAFTRHNGVYNLYINGNRVWSTISASTANYPAANISIGGRLTDHSYDLYGSDGETFYGYIEDFRITKNQSLYKTNFTPPTQSFEVDYTTDSFLLRPTYGCNRSIITSSTTDNYTPLLTHTNLVTATEGPQGNTGSLFFNGAGNSYATAINTTSLNFSNQEFTIQAWIKPTVDITSATCLFNVGPAGIVANSSYYRGYALRLNKNNKICFTYTTTSSTVRDISFGNSSDLTANTWHHIAIIRNGTTLTCYVDGNQSGSVGSIPETIADTAATDILGIGGSNTDTLGTPAAEWFTGYLADLHFASPVALYDVISSTISPATSPIQPTLHTKLLYRFPFNGVALSSKKLDSLYIGGIFLPDSNIIQNTTIVNNLSVSNIYINNSGTLIYPNTYNKVIQVTGKDGVVINAGGIMNIGTINVPVPANISHSLILSGNCLDVLDGGNLSVVGSYKLPYTTLSVSAVSGSNIFNLRENISTWNNNDTIALTPSPSNTIVNRSVLFNNTRFLESSSPPDLGTGQFTIECWIKPSSSIGLQQILGGCGIVGSWFTDTAIGNRASDKGWMLGLSGTNVNSLFFRIDYDNGDGLSTFAAANCITTEIWQHVAVSRDSSSTLRLFVNGNIVASTVFTGDCISGFNGVRIGNCSVAHIACQTREMAYNGYISNLRIVKNQCLYARQFVPPKYRLNVNDVQFGRNIPEILNNNIHLLACQGSNPYIDNSPSPKTFLGYYSTNNTGTAGCYYNTDGNIPTSTDLPQGFDLAVNTEIDSLGFDILQVQSKPTNTSISTTVSSIFNHGDTANINVPTICNLTRNIIIRGIDNINTRGSIRFIDSAKAIIQNAQLSSLGLSYNDTLQRTVYNTGNKHALLFDTNSASNIQLYNNSICNIRSAGISPRPYKGLMAHYVNHTSSVYNVKSIPDNSVLVSRAEPTINYNWSTSAPAPGVNADNFGVRWVGYVTPKYSELYKFTITQDDSVRIRINDEQYQFASGTFSAKLTANIPHLFVVDHIENTSTAAAAITWSSPSQPSQILPLSCLYLTKESLPSTIYNLTADKNIFINSSESIIDIEDVNIYNVSLTNNLLLSSAKTAVIFSNVSASNCNMNNNYVLSSANAGALFNSCSSNSGEIGGIFSVKNATGIILSGNNIGSFNNLASLYSYPNCGIFIDGSQSGIRNNLLQFQNLTASYNYQHGVLVSQNLSNVLTPIYLNLTGLSSSSNRFNGIAVSGVAGSLQDIVLSANFLDSAYILPGAGYLYLDNVTCITPYSVVGIHIPQLSHSVGNVLINNATIKTADTSILLQSPRFEQFTIQNSTLSSTNRDISFLSDFNPVEGSYLLSNTNINTKVSHSDFASKYQSNVFNEIGLSVMKEDGNNNIKYRLLDSGKISAEYNLPNVIVAGDVSEKLEPISTTIPLRSSSRLIPVNAGNVVRVAAFVKIPTDYTGTIPRLIIKHNSSLGINQDFVAAIHPGTRDTWEGLVGTTPSVLEAGIVEAYVECSGSLGSGSIYLGRWAVNVAT